MRLILYGLGQGLELVEQKIKSEHEIVGYTDSYSSLKFFKGKRFYKLEDLPQCSFDFIIITVQQRKAAWTIFNMLVEDYKFDRESIFPYYVYANYAKYDFKMRNNNLEKVEGLIFGNSHAMYGFLEREFSIPFLNLAIPWHDIWCNYKTFEECIVKYGEQLKNLQYIVIDLYDYCYFNLDLSMTSYAIEYIAWGGIPEEHNFKNNHNFQKTFNEELFDRLCMLREPHMACQLFNDIDVNYDDRNRWNHIDQKGNLARGPIIGNIASKRYEATIKENTKLLDFFLEKIKKFNKEINIIFTLIPRYIDMELITEVFMNSWKSEFNEIVNDLCKKYQVVFWNYKNRKELSENYRFYYDVEHMNTTGGRALTSILNEDLIKYKKSL